ncbi:cation transporter [Shewanella sp. Choline-02u-19]|uniref:ion transporter n=1 Tax=unclassified Shewanella TaxID=196818 RepID=UPI000C325D7E|nr:MULTISPECIES: ion transporter [unclassified Shewanella]PKG57031.1 cation transporter [Shewanella sp. GutDb-MelDb]PKH54537.1 cation transporter [Shewanella sp. Bg11-22]PKI28595.1 cation transporter [Shewanella sp. Choline-02u-19]
MLANVSVLQSKLKLIDNSKAFQGFVIFVILVSALSIGAHTYHLPNWMEKGLLLLDIGITVFFAIEIIIRFLASDGPKRFFSSGWNIFDTIIVIGSLIPAGGSAILLARLLRIFRVLRLVSMIPELRMLVNALFKAIPRMGYIALLMFVIFYIYGAIGSMLFADINDFLWGDVSVAMLTLFRVSTFESWTSVMYETMAVYPLSWIYYLSFIFLTAFVFLNMMVGAVLDVMTQETAAMRAEEEAELSDDEKPASVADVAELKVQIEELKCLLLQRAG